MRIPAREYGGLGPAASEVFLDVSSCRLSFSTLSRPVRELAVRGGLPLSPGIRDLNAMDSLNMKAFASPKFRAKNKGKSLE